jgi:hypothetical protein
MAAAPTRAKLEVHGAAGYTSGIFGGEGMGIAFQRDFPGIGFNEYYSTGSKYISTGYGAKIFFDTNIGTMVIDMLGYGAANANTVYGGRAFTISKTGNVGIRISPTNATLGVIKAGNFEGSAVFGGTTYNSHFHYSNTEDTYIRAGKPGSNVYINDIPNSKLILGSGTSYVGINSPDPQCALEIRQTGLTGLILIEPLETYNNWEQVVGFYNAGPHSSLKYIYNGTMKTFCRPTDGEMVDVSDRRLKMNIQPLNSLLHKIMQLRPVEYEMMNADPNTKTIGFIAQEVKQVFPEMVSVSPNKIAGKLIEDFHGINYNPFKILAVKAVQEEQALIEGLQQQQFEMEKKMDAIEKKLSIKN